MSRWFRHYAGMCRDEKLVSAAIKSKQPVERVVWIFGAILESAAEIDDNGRYDFDAAEAAYFLRADEADILAILSALEASGRLAGGCVVKWGSRQFSSDRSKERVAAYRERKRGEGVKSDAIPPSRNAGVTLQKRHCNAPDTDTDTNTSSLRSDVDRTEKSRPKKSAAGDGEKSLLDSGVQAETLEAWKGVRKAKRAGPISVIAAAGLLREAIKARVSADDAVRIAVERGWQTFKADWVQGNARAGPALGAPRRGAAGLVDALRELENEERSDDQRKPDGALFLLPGSG